MAKTHQEEKQIKLADNPFLLGLIDQGMVYQGYSPDKVITVIAVEGYYGDWAAYFETPDTPFRNVADYGNKLPEKAATEIFPEWPKTLKWRP